MCGLKRLRFEFLTLIALGLSSASLRAGEFYYVLIFGSQPHPKQLRYSHTWATFVRAVGEGPDANSYAIEAHTISWMPASLEVKVFSPTPEPGVNLSLDATFQLAQRHRENVTLWGPFRIGPEVYQRSLEIHRTIDSGVIEYRAISNARNLLISDCIHAVAAVDPIFGRRHYPLIRIGNSASRYVARQVRERSVYDQDTGDNEWLIPRLGLTQYPIRVVPPSAIRKREHSLSLLLEPSGQP